jgi:hypothetical protein
MEVPMDYVNSYDKTAPLPAVGSMWVWELDLPHARALIEVVDVLWNNEEWWVQAKTLLPAGAPQGRQERITHFNDLSRFWEAVTPVRRAASVPVAD